MDIAVKESLHIQISDLYDLFCKVALGKNVPTEDVQDVVHEAVVEILEHGNEAELRKDFASWAMGVLHHKVADYHRRKKRQDRKIVPLEGLEGNEPFGPSPEQILEEKERDELLRAAGQKLKGKDKKRFQLIMDQGMTDAEIAKELGVSESTGRQQVCRLREKLFKAIHEMRRAKLRKGRA